MKLAVVTHSFINWGGGIDFIKYVLGLIEDQPDVDISLLMPTKDMPFFFKKKLYPYYHFIKQIKNHESLELKKIDIISFSNSLNKFDFDTDRKNLNYIQAGSTFKSQVKSAHGLNVNIILPCLQPLSKNFSIPWLGYIPDCQHKYLPHLFSKKEICNRDIDFYNMLITANHVLVNSKAVIDDLKFFYGPFSAKLHILPFSPYPEKCWLIDNIDVRDKYNVRKPYFIVCNQFWKHKDHRTLFKAFSELLNHFPDYELVCTGLTHDYRFPNYFEELRSLINSLKINKKVKILGYIPKKDQVSLLKYSEALIQPTLFEGGPGGGSCFQAISMGVPVIASNIPVNLEMCIGDICYFEAGSSIELTKKLIHHINYNNNARSSDDILWLQGMQRKRIGELAFMDIIKDCIRN